MTVMGCGCNKGNTGNTGNTAKATAAAKTARPPLFEVMDGNRIAYRTRDERLAKSRADSIPNGRYRPAGQP